MPPMQQGPKLHQQSSINRASSCIPFFVQIIVVGSQTALWQCGNILQGGLVVTLKVTLKRMRTETQSKLSPGICNSPLS